MKTAISSQNNLIDSGFERRFGRAGWFCVFDDINGNTEFIKNTNSELKENAGIKTAETLINIGVQRIISGHFGINAKELLMSSGIQLVILSDDFCRVDEIIAKLKANTISDSQQKNLRTQ